MNREDYRPTPPVDTTATHDGDRWMLVFVRDLPHAPERTWNALTNPDELRNWSPFDPDRNLGTTGQATLTMAGASADDPDGVQPSIVRHADPPRLLEYTWGTDVLRWELEPTPSGTRLTLHHTVEDRPWLPKVAAGWHICLDVMDLMLDGKILGRIAGEDARHEWGPLNEAYSAQLGV